MTRRDQEAFIGRTGEVHASAELFVDDPPASVVVVHGPGDFRRLKLASERLADVPSR